MSKNIPTSLFRINNKDTYVNIHVPITTNSSWHITDFLVELTTLCNTASTLKSKDVLALVSKYNIELLPKETTKVTK